jgi:hypothetical protein
LLGQIRRRGGKGEPEGRDGSQGWDKTFDHEAMGAFGVTVG